MEDERTVPALVSVYKAEVLRHLGFCGNAHFGPAACRAPCEKPSRLQLALVSGAQLPSPRIIRDFGLLFL